MRNTARSGMNIGTRGEDALAYTPHGTPQPHAASHDLALHARAA